MPRKSWWARLPFAVRMTAGASAILVVTGGTAVAAAAFIDPEPGRVTAVGREAPGAAAVPRLPSAEAGLGAQTGASGAERPSSGRTVNPEPSRTTTADPTPAAGAAAAGDGDGSAARPARPATPAAAGSVVTTRTVTERRAIRYRTRFVRDRRLARGDRRVETPGVDGEQILRFRVTYVDGRQADRRLLKTVVTRQPQHRVVAVGTRDHHDNGGVGGSDGGSNGDDGSGSGSGSGGDGGDGGSDGGSDGGDGNGGNDGGSDGDDGNDGGSDDGGSDGDDGNDGFGDDGFGDDGFGDGGSDGEDASGDDGCGGDGGDGQDCGPGIGGCRSIGRSAAGRTMRAGDAALYGRMPGWL